MRRLIYNFVKICNETIFLQPPIYEFGSFQVKGQEKIANLRTLFPHKEYFGCDMRRGDGVDLILNLHSIELPSNSINSILLMDTLEHVERPAIAINELYRVLRTDGILIMSSVMNFPIHQFPYDYWRFTPDGLLSLLNVFENKWVGYAGDPTFPHTVVGLGFKGIMPNLDNFYEEYKKWQTKPDIKNLISAITPPFILGIYRRIKPNFNP